jgi:death on curing protein
MVYLTLTEVLDLYRQIMARTGGALGIHSLGALESALAQPRMTFGSDELYPTLIEKASALAFSLIQNHPFLDGNKALVTPHLKRFCCTTATNSRQPLASKSKLCCR